MRGPSDQSVDATAAGIELATTEPERIASIRPPGGKALLRLVDTLVSAGLGGDADRAVTSAVGADQNSAWRERAAAFVAVPDLPGGGSRRRRAKAAQAPVEASVEAAELAQAMIDAAHSMGQPTATGPQWRSLGPTTIPGGQTYGASRVNVSGRVSAIAVDPGNPAHVLCGAANGGVWESFDRGNSWAPRTDYSPSLAVGALAFDPSNPHTVYCGLGEGNWWSWLGAGVLKSTDGGTTWTTLCTAPFVGVGFYDLQVDPGDSARLFAATNAGLYVSNDGGVHWTQRRAFVTWSVSIVAPNGEILAGCSDGVHHSADHGVTWTTARLPGVPGGFTRLAVAIARTNHSVAYAWGAGDPNTTNGPTPYLWRRQNGRWTTVAPPPGVATGQSWYDWFLAVAPDNANQIYCGAISAYRGDHAGGTWTWLDIATKTSGDSIHPDQHAIAFESGNPDTIYIGCDGGLFQSPDRGVHWVHRNNGLVISELEYLAHNIGSSRWLLAGTQDNGTDRWQGSPIWDHVADGDGGDCASSRSDPTLCFHTYYGMSPERSNSSADWGSWTWIGPPVPSGEGSPFYPPFEASSTNGSTIAMAGNALYVSRDSGTSWTRLDYPGGNGSGSAMYIPDADTVLVGLGDGRLLRTVWNGSSWPAPSVVATPRATAMTDIITDPNNGNRIWVTYGPTGGGRVYRSEDGGTTFTDYTNNLPALPITAIAVDPWNGNRAWVSASLGVYQTFDGGASWSAFADSLPNCYIGDLLFHPSARVLRAGTRNRGAWEIPVDGWMTAPACGTQWDGTLAANQTLTWFTFNWPATWHIVWTIMPTTVGTAAQLSWNVAVQRASAEFATYWISVTNLTGAPVSFEGRYCILSRY